MLLFLSGMQTQGSRSQGKGVLWRRRESLDHGELPYWPPVGIKHNLFDLDGTLFQEMRDGTAMHSGEKGRLDLFTTMCVNSGLHEWTANGACLSLVTGLGGEEALGERKGEGDCPLYRQQMRCCWFVFVVTHELFATVVAGPEPRTSLA